MLIKRKLQKSVICPKKKQFQAIVVCAYDCKNKCNLYLQNVTINTLEKFILKHPEYEIIGELMATKKLNEKPVVKSSTAKPKEKIYWVIDENGVVTEVKESEIINNPKEYLERKIYDRPPFEYEVVVALKKKKL